METNETRPQTMPRIGEKAPAFKAVTTQGEISFPDQYAGHWGILFSHPADFTPVCTSEFMTLASLEPKFDELDCKLVGLSVDGLYSHIAWLRTIKEKVEYKGMKDIEVTFPLIEDITMDVARKYGMIQPGESSTKAVRAVFVIDPKGTIRTIIYYPLSLGRNFDDYTFNSFPDIHFDIKTAVSDGNLVAITWVMTGTNTGKIGEFPATNKKIEANGATIYHFMDRKICGHTQVYDRTTIMRQLGFIK